MSQTTCLHTMMDGHRCGCVALTGEPYCYFHARHHVHNARPSDPDYELPIFEDSRSLLVAIRELVDAYMKGKIDQKHTTTMLYAYQIAMSGVHRPDGMSPDALRQLEIRELALAQARKRSPKPDSGDEEEEPKGPGFIEYFVEQLSKSGKPIDLDSKHLPPDQRPSRVQVFIDALESRRVRKDSDKPKEP